MLAAAIFHSQPMKAQDVHLSQFYETPLMRNPALAGIFTGDVRVQIAYRNQWQSLGVPFQTSIISGEYKMPVGRADDFLTLGINSFYDVAGSSRLKTFQLMPAVNFHKSLDGERNRYLSLGFMGGVVQRSFNAKDLTFDNQYSSSRGYDPSAPTGEIFSGMRRSFADMAVGMSFNSNIGETGNFYIGASLWHFNKPTERFINEEIQLSPKWQGNAGIRLMLSDVVRLTSEFNYVKQGAYTEIIGGGIVSYIFNDMTDAPEGLNHIAVGLGAMLRVGDALVPVVQLEYNSFNLGFSYDLNYSQLMTASQGRGGFELTLSWRAFVNSEKSSVEAVRCPRF